MKILLTNDDGYSARGLLSILRELVEAGHEVRVVAPATEQSGVSHALTLHHGLRTRRVHYTPEFLRELGFEPIKTLENVLAWNVLGTPADCAQFALLGLWGGPKPLYEPWNPELVISGINKGNNAGYNVLYSGTVAGAMEGSIQGVPSVALSLNHPPDYPSASEAWPYKMAAKLSMDVIKKIVKITDKVDKTTFWNVNIPNVDTPLVKGIKLCKQGGWTFSEYFYEIERTSEEDISYVRRGEIVPDQNFETEEYDTIALHNGWITVTPLNHFLDRLDKAELKTIQKEFK